MVAYIDYCVISLPRHWITFIPSEVSKELNKNIYSYLNSLSCHFSEFTFEERNIRKQQKSPIKLSSLLAQILVKYLSDFN